MIGGSNKVCGNDPLAVYRSLVSDKSVTTANIGTLTTLIYDTAVPSRRTGVCYSGHS